jgi:hypothetical protein
VFSKSIIHCEFSHTHSPEERKSLCDTLAYLSEFFKSSRKEFSNESYLTPGVLRSPFEESREFWETEFYGEKKLNRLMFLYHMVLKIILITIDRVILFMLYIFQQRLSNSSLGHHTFIRTGTSEQTMGEQTWQ